MCGIVAFSLGDSIVATTGGDLGVDLEDFSRMPGRSRTWTTGWTGSLSQCDRGVLVVMGRSGCVSLGSLGCDWEVTRPGGRSFVKRVLSGSEQDLLLRMGFGIETLGCIGFSVKEAAFKTLINAAVSLSGPLDAPPSGAAWRYRVCRCTSFPWFACRCFGSSRGL